MKTTLPDIRRQLHTAASVEQAANLQRFFKTGPGQYGAGDVFLGIKVPPIRRLVPSGDEMALAEVCELLHSRYHEERLLALLILVRRFQRSEPPMQQKIFELYLRETRYINNWDLVDLSAPQIVGGWLLIRPRKLLDDLARSELLWERRIAVLATFTFIRHGQFDDTLRLCERLLNDPHDLMHKACGWMLREVGKREVVVLSAFLEQHALAMPRTMLRYAIERYPETQRQAWLRVKPAA
ncbi:MAG: DNA alkylation repair protein [Verrucomicrobiota bacterium]